ncbi:zinc finger, CCHC-type containing protein [Tanacetum coccineum]
MTDLRPVMEQYNELLGILGRFTQHKKEELTLVELGSHLRIEKSLRVQDSDKPKGNNVAGPLIVNMVEHNNSIRYNDNKGKRKQQDTKTDHNKKSKVTCWKCEKPGHLKRDCKGGKVGNKTNGSSTNGSVNNSSNSLKGATVHVCKDRCWFKTYELNIVNDIGDSAFMSTSKLNDLILWHARLSHDDPKTFDEAMKSQDVAFSKEAINDEIDSITGNDI